jgi:hypothetical protein
MTKKTGIVWVRNSEYETLPIRRSGRQVNSRFRVPRPVAGRDREQRRGYRIKPDRDMVAENLERDRRRHRQVKSDDQRLGRASRERRKLCVVEARGGRPGEEQQIDRLPPSRARTG